MKITVNGNDYSVISDKYEIESHVLRLPIYASRVRHISGSTANTADGVVIESLRIESFENFV